MPELDIDVMLGQIDFMRDMHSKAEPKLKSRIAQS